MPASFASLIVLLAGGSQIKLRGFCIELEDVANIIVETSGGIISEAAVSLREGISGDGDSAYLVAFAIISQINRPSGLDQYALDALPVPLEADTTHEALTETQERLKLEWLKVLPPVGTDATIGPDTDFFSAGGNSLRIVTLREHIGREFGVTISVFDLFQASTLGEMAAKIDGSALQNASLPSNPDWQLARLRGTRVRKSLLRKRFSDG
ncbi:hypothetical protein ACHAP5_012253 [Fusarium lateritium]